MKSESQVDGSKIQSHELHTLVDLEEDLFPETDSGSDNEMVKGKLRLSEDNSSTQTTIASVSTRRASLDAEFDDAAPGSTVTFKLIIVPASGIQLRTDVLSIEPPAPVPAEQPVAEPASYFYLARYL